MLIRIIVGFGCGLFALGLTFLTGTPAFPAIFAVVSVWCEFELLRCAGTLRRPLTAGASFLAAAAGPLAAGFAADGAFAGYALPAAAVYLLIIAAAYTFSVGAGEKEKPRLTLEQSAVTGFFTLYLSLAFGGIVAICRTGEGRIIFPMIFIAAWCTDVFAYFSGYFFGKHKLIPLVSPKKTVEGAIGGTLICTLIFVVYGLVAGVADGSDALVNILLLALLGVLSSAVAQAGDLLMSALKRHYGIKDFGKSLPGHGGFLDRFDSVVAVSCVFYLFLTVFSVF